VELKRKAAHIGVFELKRKPSKSKKRKPSKRKYWLFYRNDFHVADKEDIEAVERVWRALVKRGVII